MGSFAISSLSNYHIKRSERASLPELVLMAGNNSVEFDRLSNYEYINNAVAII